MPTIRAGGLTVHYQWQGREDGPVLVLINGLLTDLGSWKGHLPFFTDHFRVLTYDCRGQGGTEKPEEGPYYPEQHADDLKALLDGLGVGDAYLLGVSNGAVVALQFAVNWPDWVKGLVLANGYGRADTALQVKLNSWLAGMAAGGPPLRFDVATPWVWGASFLNRHYEALKPFREKASTMPEHAVRHLIAGAMRFDVLERAAEITCPTLLLTGDEDVLTPLSYAHALQRQIRGSRVVMLPEAGHAMFLEQVERFAEVTSGFLRGLLPSGPSQEEA